MHKRQIDSTFDPWFYGPGSHIFRFKHHIWQYHTRNMTFGVSDDKPGLTQQFWICLQMCITCCKFWRAINVQHLAGLNVRMFTVYWYESKMAQLPTTTKLSALKLFTIYSHTHSLSQFDFSWNIGKISWWYWLVIAPSVSSHRMNFKFIFIRLIWTTCSSFADVWWMLHTKI